MTRRIVVTGLGAVCGLGRGTEALWRGLLGGRTAIRPLDRFDAAAHRTRLAAEVPQAHEDGTPGSAEGRLSLADRFALAAAAEALAQAGLAPPGDTAEAGVFFGSSTGGMWESERWYARLLGRESGRPGLGSLVSQQYNGPGDAVARWAGAHGPVETVSSACTSGAVAIAAAADALREGEVDLALAGGSDSLCQLTYAGFNSLRAVDAGPCLPFRAEPPTEASLAVTHTDLAIVPDPAREGRPLDVTASVRNLGGGTATNVLVAFFDGDPAAGGVEIGRANLAAIAAGGAASAAITWPRVPSPADRQIHVVVDPENQIAELNEEDNRSFRGVSVLSLPDLALGAGSIRLQPRFPVQGQPAQATVVVDNLGEQESTFTVRVLGGVAAGAGAPVAPDQEVTIAGKGSAEASFGWRYADGTSVLTAIVDPSSAVEEGSEANNVAALAVTEQQGDFFVDERHFSPNGDGVRDRTTFFFSLETPANVAVEVWDPQRGEVVRRQAGADLEGVREGSFTWDGRDAAGRVVRDTTWVLRVVDAAGREFGSSWAIVDTDRSSLLEAAGTPYESVANLTCQMDEPEDPVFTADEQWLYFMLNFATTPPHGNGIYRVRPTGADLQTIVPKTWFGTDNWPIAVTVSPDGAHVLFVTDWRELWIVEGSGGTPRRLAPTTPPVR